jgi:hypothetical protein
MGHANRAVHARFRKIDIFFMCLRIGSLEYSGRALFVICCLVEQLFRNGAFAMRAVHLHIFVILVALIPAR